MPVHKKPGNLLKAPRIYIHHPRQTVSFYQNSSVWLDTQPGSLDLCFRPLGHQADHVGSGNFMVFLFLETAAAAAFVYIFYTLSATRVLNSFEELWIMQAAAGNSFARELNPHGGAYIHTHIHTHIYIYIYICVCVCVCVCNHCFYIWACIEPV